MRHDFKRGRSAAGRVMKILAVVALSCALGACGRNASPPSAPAAKPAANPSLANMHADAPGIAWFDGDVNAAFAAAKASNKPVLLYWGAQWCPPCKQLKSAVFSRPRAGG
jgi:thiol:disulfide interchange protein